MLKNKKMLKLCIASFFISTNLLSSTLVNGISVLVNDEPITLYEIHKISQQEKISLDESLQILIQKRLQDSQIKNLGINASSYEITNEINQIAKQNNMQSDELLNVLLSQGVDENSYRQSVAENIKLRKLFQRIFSDKSPIPTNFEMEDFYKKNPQQFVQSNTFDISVYSAKSKTALLRIAKNPFQVNQSVKIEQKTLHANDLDKKKLYFLNQTPKGKFTPPIATENGYAMYLINSKSNTQKLPFAQAKPLIEEFLTKQNQKQAVDNYFNKIKADAHIEVIRKP